MARKPIISGNWKMNLNHFEAIQLVQKLNYLIDKDDYENVDVTIHPSFTNCLLYTSPSPRDATLSRMPSSA